MNKYECEECSRGFNVIEKLEDHDCPIHLSAQTELLEKIKELEEKLADCQKGVRNAAEINRLLANRNDDLKQQLVDYETDWRKMRKYYDGAMEKMAIAIEALEKADKTLSLTYYSFQPVRQDINEALEKIKR